MNKSRLPIRALLALFFLTLSVSAFVCAYTLKAHQKETTRSEIHLLNWVLAQAESQTTAFGKSDNHAVKSLRRLFAHNTSLLRQEMIRYQTDVLKGKKTRTSFITLLMALSGLYYLFAAIGIFHARLNSLARLRIAVSLWTVTLFTLLVNLYFHQTALRALLDRLEILSYYGSSGSNPGLLPPTDVSTLPPVLLMFLLLNILIYIFLPLWYINQSKMKKSFS